MAKCSLWTQATQCDTASWVGAKASRKSENIPVHLDASSRSPVSPGQPPLQVSPAMQSWEVVGEQKSKRRQFRCKTIEIYALFPNARFPPTPVRPLVDMDFNKRFAKGCLLVLFPTNFVN